MLRKLSLLHAFDTKYVQNRYFEGKCSGHCHFYMLMMSYLYKMLLCRQMLRKSLLSNAFGTTYVQIRYFKGKCSGNDHF